MCMYELCERKIGLLSEHAIKRERRTMSAKNI